MFKIRNKILLFCLTLIPFMGSAQKNHDGLIIHRSISNYGVVDVWMPKVDSFLVTNSTNKTIYILNQMVPREFEIRYPKLGIEPGQSSFLEIIYDPNDVGKFKKKLKFYHSASSKPFFIQLSGEIKSFDEYSRLACPSFSKPQRKISFDMEILVIDSLTKEPISNALVELGKGESYLQYKTNSNGMVVRKSSLGLFYIYTEASGYTVKEVEHYFNPKSRSITITLVQPQPSPKEMEIIPIETKPFVYADSVEEGLNKPQFTYQPNNTNLAEEENKDFSLAQFKENNIVFLIDVSSSMRGRDRLELLKKSIIQLTSMLRSVDKITIITYADEANVVLKPTQANNKEKIAEIVVGLKASGSTNGGKAIKKAYKILEDEFIPGGNNQIILATDGGFNGLGRSEYALTWLVKRKAKNEMFFSVLGFGKSKRGKDLIEQLSVIGGGLYKYITNEEEASKDLNLMIMNQSFRN